MPYTDQLLPWSGKNSVTRHNSHAAAVSAKATRARKSAGYLDWLIEVGQATDWGTVEHFGWPMSSVTSIRNGLVDKGLVEVMGSCVGKYGKRVAIWRARSPR